MDKNFKRLLDSIRQMGDIVRKGQPAPRETHYIEQPDGGMRVIVKEYGNVVKEDIYDAKTWQKIQKEAEKKAKENKDQ